MRNRCVVATLGREVWRRVWRASVGPHVSATVQTTEVAVIGGGPAGLVCAIALAAAGVETVLVAPPHAGADHRTTALLAGSVAALETLGVWSACLSDAAPLRQDSHDRRYGDGSFARLRSRLPPRKSASMPSVTTSRTTISSQRSKRAPGAVKLPRVAAPALSVESDEAGVTVEYAERRAACAARYRCGWIAVAVPCRRRHRHAAARLSAVGAHAQSRTRAAAQRYFDGISHRKWPVHASAPARPAFKSGLCAGAGGCAETCRHRRRCARRRHRAPRPFAAWADARRARPRPVSRLPSKRRKLSRGAG